MKVAFVMGFFSPVGKALEAEFAKELGGGALVFLAKPSQQQSFDLNRFKSQFFPLARAGDPDPILVIAADVRGFERVRYSLERIVESARAESKGREIGLLFLEDTQNPDPVLSALYEFELRGAHAEAAVTEAQLLKHTNGQRILCIRGQNQPEFQDALRRAGIQFERFEDHFVEVGLKYSPNVSHVIKNYAKQHTYLLYAWGDLKYLEPSGKKKWKSLHQGETPAATVARFKQAVLAQSTEDNENC